MCAQLYGFSSAKIYVRARSRHILQTCWLSLQTRVLWSRKKEGNIVGFLVERIPGYDLVMELEEGLDDDNRHELTKQYHTGVMGFRKSRLLSTRS
jgi:hypothetical protein